MDHMVFVLYSGTVQLKAERDLKLTRLSAIISPCLTKLLKHIKWNIAFWHEIVVIFSPFCLSEITYVISSFSPRIKL